MSGTSDPHGGVVMIFAWVGLVVAVAAVVIAVPGSTMISAVGWPGEAPLNLHDNRARDPHLRHLARILGSDSTAEAQRAIADLGEGVVTSSSVTLRGGEAAARERIGATLRRFVDEPPAKDHREFLRQLSAALEQIERL